MADVEQLPVAAARAGDAGAWDALFRRYQLPLYVYVFELVRNEQTSLDIVQETFISAVRHLGTLRDDAKFGSWLFGIAHQKCIQRWRWETRDTALREELGGEAGALESAPDELLIRAEQEAEFMRCVESLPPPHRSVLLLHFIQEFSLEEIADITGVALGTVKSRLHYAKRTLRKLIEGQSL